MAGFLSNTFALLQLSLFFTLLASIDVMSRGLSEYRRSRVVHGGRDSELLTVKGYVFCQSSEHLGDHTLADSNSSRLAGVTIRLLCNIKERILGQEFTTNKNGDFTIVLPKEYADFCQVVLIYSPIERCSTPTNLNGGLDGSHLNYNNKVTTTDDSVISSHTINVGPFAFVPDMLDKRIVYHSKFQLCFDVICDFNCGCCTCDSYGNCQCK